MILVAVASALLPRSDTIERLPPGGPTEGPVPIEVITAEGRSSPMTVQKQRYAPAFFMFGPDGRKYLAAVHSDGTLVPNCSGDGKLIRSRRVIYVKPPGRIMPTPPTTGPTGT